MRDLVIAAVVLSLTLGGTSNVRASDEGATSSPAIQLAEEEDSGTGAGDRIQRGLSRLPESNFNSGGSVVSDVVSLGEKLVAVGYGITLDGRKTHGAAWTSLDGRTWKKTHRLPPVYFHRAIPAVPRGVVGNERAVVILSDGSFGAVSGRQ